MVFKTNTPIYIQVIEDIEKSIITGDIKLGEKLPSSRELALKYQINPNTSARVYNELEALGISYTKRGIGTFVTEDINIIDKLKENLTREIISSFHIQMSGLGFSNDEIINMLLQYYSTL